LLVVLVERQYLQQDSSIVFIWRIPDEIEK